MKLPERDIGVWRLSPVDGPLEADAGVRIARTMHLSPKLLLARQVAKVLPPHELLLASSCLIKIQGAIADPARAYASRQALPAAESTLYFGCHWLQVPAFLHSSPLHKLPIPEHKDSTRAALPSCVLRRDSLQEAGLLNEVSQHIACFDWVTFCAICLDCCACSCQCAFLLLLWQRSDKADKLSVLAKNVASVRHGAARSLLHRRKRPRAILHNLQTSRGFGGVPAAGDWRVLREISERGSKIVLSCPQQMHLDAS